MADIFAITFPIFALVALGYGCVRAGVFKPSDMRVLGQYVLMIALPALLFNAVATRKIAEVIVPSYIAVFALGGLTTIAIAYTIATLQGTGPARRAIAVMGSACPNSAYIGFPMMMLVFPDLAGLILAMNLVVENFVLVPISFALLELSRPRQGMSLWSSGWQTLQSVLRRPLVIGLLAGMVVSVLGISIPAALSRVLEMTAASTSAIALFVIGGTLAGLPIVGNRLLAGQIVLGKLVLHPAMTALCVLAVPLLGLPALSSDLATAVVISAAVPMIGIYTIIAQDYGHEGLASLALLAATVGAFLTLNGLLILLT
ncbi:AEC family transporter [Primorskyibacter marinus]|uniref:AEC family transporter n=1 Tax=Primorskyibacter marinus TaxID=1977320 RepID=UPI000E301D78|nr:AEC family transporter [Primorskyibacter marinus]